MTNKVQVKIKTIRANAEDVFTKRVTPFGNGAIISFFKKFIGKTVYVIIKKKNNGEENGET